MDDFPSYCNMISEYVIGSFDDENCGGQSLILLEGVCSHEAAGNHTAGRTTLLKAPPGTWQWIELYDWNVLELSR